MTSDLDKGGLEAAADAVYAKGDVVYFEAELLAKAAVSAYFTQVASHRSASAPDGLEVVRWMHRETLSCRFHVPPRDSVDEYEPLVLKSAADARDAKRMAEIARLEAENDDPRRERDIAMGQVRYLAKSNAKNWDDLKVAEARVRELEAKLAEANQAVDAFSDICVELGVERDNEAGLFAAHELIERAKRLEAENARLREALTPFAAEKLPSNRPTEIDYDRRGLRRLISPLDMGRRDAFFALHPERHPLAKAIARASLTGEADGEGGNGNG